MMSTPSGARVIKVSRGREITEPEEEKQPQVFVDMQKTMEDELERRKKDWENEVERMQGDFFQMNTGPATDSNKEGKVVSTSSSKRTPGGVEIVREDSLRKSPGGAEIFDIANSKNLSNEMPDGSRTFKLRFDLHGFEPEEISVRAEGDKLHVSAKHEEQVGKGGKTARQFNRQVDIPHNVDPDKIMSHLASDGMLSVEAPLEEVVKAPRPAIQVETYVQGHSSPELDEPPFMPPGYHSVVHESQPGYSRVVSESPGYSRVVRRETPGYSSSRVVHETPGFSRVVHETPGYSSRVVRTQNYSGGHPIIGSNVTPILYQGDPATQYHSVVRSISPGRVVSTTTRTSPRMSHKAFSYNTASFEDTEYGRKLKLVVDLGGKYKPEEISLKFVGHKIHLKAKHEEKIGGRTSRCEFSREFDVPEDIELRTARAMMADDGRIHIGGSVKDNDKHDLVLEYVLMDMPSGGKPVTIVRE